MNQHQHHIVFLKASRRVALACLLLLTTVLSKAQTPTAANQVKAVFLFNFTQFVTWPPQAFAGNNGQFVIGVLGNDPFGSYLEKVVEGERVAGHPIVVQRYSEAKDIRQCHILFINKGNTAEVTGELRYPGLLTVGDKENFARDGGIIGFYLENNKLRLQINTKTAKAANLSISSKLLRLANVIDN